MLSSLKTVYEGWADGSAEIRSQVETADARELAATWNAPVEFANKLRDRILSGKETLVYITPGTIFAWLISGNVGSQNHSKGATDLLRFIRGRSGDKDDIEPIAHVMWMAAMLWFGGATIPEAERHKDWCTNTTSAVAVAPEWHTQLVLCRKQMTALAVLCAKKDVEEVNKAWPALAMNLSDMNVLQWLLLEHYKGITDPGVFAWVRARFDEETVKL
jgi:hypothetical protein